LNISDLSKYLPSNVVQHYIDSGIKKLYPPQIAAINKGLLNGSNIIAAVPTASGKTLLAELAMLKTIYNNGKVLYIVPLRALASEKYDHFSEFRKFGFKVGISTGDFDSSSEELGKNDIIITTPEKADSLLRNEASWIRDVSLIVADEIHTIGTAKRGPTLEITIVKLMHITNAQIIGLSATIGNPMDFADWLKANLITSDWRPVELREGVLDGNSVFFPIKNKKQLYNKSDNAIHSIIIDTLKENGQCLIFETSRRTAEASAVNTSEVVNRFLEQKTKKKLYDISNEILDLDDTEISKSLADCVKMGTAFHHAGLISDHRKLIEDNFRKNIIKVITSTPTLAIGLNLPARRVLIKGYKRYSPGRGMVPIDYIDYAQMAGRAGRPHLDPYGESIIIPYNNEKLDLKQKYIFGTPENLYSALSTNLRSHILSTIVNRFATSISELMAFMDKTFYAIHFPLEYIKSEIHEILSFLEKNDMIYSNPDELHSTPYGNLITILYIDPKSGTDIINGIKEIDQDECTDFGLLYLLSTLPDAETLRKIVLGANECSKKFNFGDDNEHLNNREIATAVLLTDWINEVPEKDITKKFKIGPGDLRNVTETAEWLMYSAYRILSFKKNKLAPIAKRLSMQIKYGAKPELYELLTLKYIGRVRARILYDNGYTTLEYLKSANKIKIARLLKNKAIAIKVFKQLNENVDELRDTNYIQRDTKKQYTLFDF